MATVTSKSIKQLERDFVVKPCPRHAFFIIEYSDAPGAVVPEPLRGNWTSVAYAQRALEDWKDSLTKQLNSGEVSG